MATDYNEIGQNPRINYRNIFTPYSDKTHFVYELVQNADDNKSHCIELQLYENELIVWNDGRQFTEGDVRSICSIGFSNKDLTQIGTFGMGFKAVYAYTDNPEVYSGDERFRISINNPTKPEGINTDDIDVRVLEQLDKGKTVFCLPFRKSLRQEEEIARLRDRLYNLEKRALLFLRNLKRVRWCDESREQVGSYSCHRRPHDRIQDASEVELRASINGKDQPSEKFLIFRKEVQPPQVVVDELLEQAENDDERQRIQKSAKELQPVEVAFNFQDSKITAVSNSVLFSYFPTQKETHLQFLIQASYKTTLARDNIEQDNQWNEWLIQEAADFLPEILEQLKAAELLEPAFFNVLPLEGEVEKTFEPIAEMSQKVMREREFVPTQSGGYAKVGSVFHVNSKGIAVLRGAGYRYMKAENVYYPHAEILRQLIGNNWLHRDSSWLYPEIRDTDEFRRCFKVMQEAGVKTLEVGRVLGGLKERELDWFKAKPNDWLCSLYVYLKEQGAHLERIKKLPLVRLEDGKHVYASKQLVYFPPDERTARDESIKLLLNDLPILRSILLEGKERYEIEAFLKNLGIKELDPENLIREAICPLYRKPNKPSIEQNRQHVRYIFKVWQKVSVSERSDLKEELSKTPILRVYNNIQRENSNENLQPTETVQYIVPSDTYLPKAYTGDTYLETYFSMYGGGIWFVDDTYLENGSNRKVWFQFLKTIGSMDTPRIIEESTARNSENYQEFNKELAKRDIETEYTTRWWETNIKDLHFCGLPEMLDKIAKCNEANLSRSVWRLLVKMINALPSESSSRNTFFNNRFQGIYRWFYRKNKWKFFDATFYRQLKSTSWIPDEQGDLYTPYECFAPTPENRKVLGNSVVYLSVDFGVSTEPAKWLAKKLGVRMEADTESVLNHLQKLRSDKEVDIKKIEPLYRFLFGARPRRKVNGEFGSYMVDSEPPWRSKFKKEPLIFIPNPERCWWRVDEVFWEDEGIVFGDDRGYLKSHYSKGLKSFFTTSLAVSERASASDYVSKIQRVKSIEQAANEEIQLLYEHLWQVMQESNSIFSNRLDVDPCEKFTEESLIFAPNPERCWWRVDEVFWEDEGIVFADDRGYLKAYYPETLKPFFIALGVSERAAPLDYVFGIKEVASVGKAENPEIRKRVKRLYSRVWQSLQEGGTWQETEEWKQTRESKCWLGKKGSEWDFFSRHKLVWNDHHDYVAEIFEGEIPFWIFDDLLELAQGLKIEGCSQAKVEFHPEGDQEELTDWSEKVRNLRLYIHAFLNSPRLCEAHGEDKSAHVLDSLCASLVEGLETMYTLKEISLTSPNPRPSFLDVTNQEVRLWLALEAEENDYALLIGDALQDYFGVKDLGRFTEHLLTRNRNSVLNHWKREGLRTELCISPPETDSKEGEDKSSEFVAEKLSDETNGGNANAIADGSNAEVPIDGQVPEVDGEDNESLTDQADESKIHLSNSGNDDSKTDEPEIKTSMDSKTAEVEESDNDSTSDESENHTDSASDVMDISSPDTQSSTEAGNGSTQNVKGESESETPAVNESPEVGNEDSNSTTKGSEVHTYTPSKTSGTNQSGGHSVSRSNSRKSGGGGHGGSGGGGEGEEHENLKRYLANNPSQFGEGLELFKIEYTFGSGDRVDILLKDSSENPVTVEVETGFSSGNGRYVGVWQAVKYQHLAAMEYGLACAQVRSILAAPEIPDDVKTECEKLGIEPIEVSNQTEDTDE